MNVPNSGGNKNRRTLKIDRRLTHVAFGSNEVKPYGKKVLKIVKKFSYTVIGGGGGGSRSKEQYRLSRARLQRNKAAKYRFSFIFPF